MHLLGLKDDHAFARRIKLVWPLHADLRVVVVQDVTAWLMISDSCGLQQDDVCKFGARYSGAYRAHPCTNTGLPWICSPYHMAQHPRASAMAQVQCSGAPFNTPVDRALLSCAIQIRPPVVPPAPPQIPPTPKTLAIRVLPGHLALGAHIVTGRYPAPTRNTSPSRTPGTCASSSNNCWSICVYSVRILRAAEVWNFLV